MFDFADLEEPHRKLYNMKGEWMFRDDATPAQLSEMNLAPIHGDECSAWRPQFPPPLLAPLVPFVKDIARVGFSEEMTGLRLYG